MTLSILLDANAMGHADHHGTKLSVGSLQTQSVFGAVRRIRDLAFAYPAADITVLWDGKAVFRYEIFPKYKANRVAKDDADVAEKQTYHTQVPLIRAAYAALGMRQIIPDNLEADDLGGYLARRISKVNKVLLVTGDSDWLQLVNENTTWLDPRGPGKKITLENFHDQTGYFSPQEYFQGKAMIGDSADGIPPVGGIGKKGAAEFMAKFRSVEAFWAQCDAGTFTPPSSTLSKLWKGTTRDNYERNIKLMTLGEDQDRIKAAKLTVIHEPLNEDKFRMICEKLCFMSITKHFDDYMAPFRARQLKRAA
jgi:DNA polymerase-1